MHHNVPDYYDRISICIDTMKKMLFSQRLMKRKINDTIKYA